MKSYGTITCTKRNIFKVLNHFILVPRNYSSKANFIRIPADASPAQVKELVFREDPHKVNLFQ